MGVDELDKPATNTADNEQKEQVLEVQVAANQVVTLPEITWENEWDNSMRLLRDLKQKSVSQNYLTLSEKELVDLRSIVMMNRALVTTFIQGLENKDSKWHSAATTDRQCLISTMNDMAQRLYQHNNIMKGLLDKIQTRFDTPDFSHPQTSIHMRNTTPASTGTVKVNF